MKIFNIEDTKELFETLNNCNGSVELVSKDGSHIALTQDRDAKLNLLAETYVNGSIKEMELSFSDSRDVMTVAHYLTGMHVA